MQAWLKGGMVGVVEATDALVLYDQSAVLDTLWHKDLQVWSM